MKAMLYSDFLNFKQSMKTLTVMLVFFAIMAFVSQNIVFFGSLLVMVCLILPFNMFSYDAAYGWDKLTLSLPISRVTVIGSKYILCAVIAVTMLLFSFCGILVFCLRDPTLVLLTQCAMLLFCVAAALLLISVMLPLVVKFGVAKGRYILLGVVWIPIMVVLLLQGAKMLPSFAVLDTLLTNISPLPFAVVALICAAALYGVSALISISIYKKREF